MRTSLRSVAVVALVLLGCDPEEDTSELTAPEVMSYGNLPIRSNWRYWDRGGDIGTAWRGGSFPDDTWGRGRGPLGYGETYVTPISFGPDASNKYITSYFRAQFILTDADTLVGIDADLMYDDGVVVYLNGTEISRRSMPAGTVTWSTRALGHEANNTYERLDWSAYVGLLVEGTNTLAVEVHQSDPASSDLVFDLGVTFRIAQDDQIGRGSVWSYWDRGGDLGATWRARSYDDASWAKGAGPLGYGETYLRTTVGYGPSATNKYITTYFRHAFNVPDPAAVTRILGEVMFDDGFVVYLNGTRIGADAMPAGTITAATLSTGHEAGNAYKAYDWSAQRNLLVAGTNVIAIEVHQQSASSSDLVFDAALAIQAATAPPAEATYRIDARSTWRYWDRGPALGTWPALGFDDSSWSSGPGPLGYGESYIATTVSFGNNPEVKNETTYFRKTFRVEDPPSVVVRLRGDVMYDDGFVAYLNGHEVWRVGMPAGTPGFHTLAASHEAGNAYDLFDWMSAQSFLVPGENVLAVEVHQASLNSSDLVFDLALDVREVPTFSKYAGNPVVQALPQPPGEPYYDYARRDPTVVHLPGGSWVMYLVDDGPFLDSEIYRAVSADGVSWTVDAAPVWMGFQPTVLFDGTTYRMWYAENSEDGSMTSIFLATSTDGIAWTAGAPGPVVTAADGSGWENHIFNPTVIRDGATYKMWYEAQNLATSTYALGYATSPDGVHWTRRPTPLPITNLTNHGTSLGDPFVLKERGDYKMWYSALNRSIEYATSPDGITWTMWPVIAVPRTFQSGAWDELIRMGAVVRDGERFRLWYFGIAGNNGIHQIGYATH